MSRNQQIMQDYKLHLDKPHVDNGITCLYCFSPFADLELVDKK